MVSGEKSISISLFELLNYRPLEEADLPWFLELRNEVRFFLHDNREFSSVECREWFQSNSNFIWVICIKDFKIGYFRLKEHGQDGTFQIGLDLNKNFRGLGLARPLYFHFCKSVASKCGAKELQLRVLKTNRRAMKLYESMCFTVFEETPMDYAMKCSLDTLLSTLLPISDCKNLGVLPLTALESTLQTP